MYAVNDALFIILFRIFISEKTAIATAHELSFTYSHIHYPFSSEGKAVPPPPWKLTIPNLEVLYLCYHLFFILPFFSPLFLTLFLQMSVTPQVLANIPALISSNFSEPEPLKLPERTAHNYKKGTSDLSSSSSSSFSSSFSSVDDNVHVPGSISSSSPLIKLVINDWLLKLLYSQLDQQNVTMATVKLEKVESTFGVKVSRRSRKVWLKGFIDEIAGVEGSLNDNYHGNWRYIWCTHTCTCTCALLMHIAASY